MLNRLTQDNKGIAVIQDPNAEEDDKAYCPQCSTYRNKLHKLGPLIILDPSKPLPPDYDDWKQCGYCYTKVPIYDVRHEGKLFTDIEGITNPFDSTTKSEGVHKKGLHNRMKEIAKKNKQKDDYSKDKEVMAEIRDGAVITGYYNSVQEEKNK